MRCFCLLIFFSFFCLVSCKKNIQTFLYSDTIIEDYQTKDGVTQDYLIICKAEPAAYTEYKEWNKHLTESLELDSSAIETIPQGIYTLMVNFKIEKDGNISETSVLMILDLV